MAALTELDLDIGGRSLRVIRPGSGGPAVVLEAGSGCGSEIWGRVEELAGEFAATYSYDRAGHGSSEPDDRWSLEGWVADLEAWSRAGQLRAVPARRTFARRPHRPRLHRPPPGRRDRHDPARRPPRGSVPDAAATVPDPAGRTAAVRPERARRADAVVRSLPDPGDLPLTVITHGQADRIPDAFGLDHDAVDRAERAWQHHQAELAARHSHSRLIVAATSGHLVSVDQPELVAAEIGAMLATLTG